MFSIIIIYSLYSNLMGLFLFSKFEPIPEVEDQLSETPILGDDDYYEVNDGLWVGIELGKGK